MCQRVGSGHGPTTALLISGGLDSAILLGRLVRRGRSTVQPLYVRGGLSWEGAEVAHLRRYLDALSGPALRPLEVLELPMADLDPGHWAVTGRGVPDASSADEAVYLPGRNLLLLSKAMVWCHLHGVPSVALGVLGTNPFPDATRGFFARFQGVVNRAIGGAVRVRRPFAGLSKIEVMRLAGGLPLELSFSCLRPANGRHCGGCNKCEERRRAFADAAMEDPTDYAALPGFAPTAARDVSQAPPPQVRSPD